MAGNFHISAGKSLQLPHGHIHIAAFISDREYNFSHRINNFAFGDFSPGIVHPLEGDEKIASDGQFTLSAMNFKPHLSQTTKPNVLFQQ